MKITKNQLSQIIKEELQRVILEKSGGEEEEEETEEVTWDTADQDNQDAQHTPWASSKEEAIEWIEEHTEAAGVGTQDTIDLVTLLIGKIKSQADKDEAWQHVSSFFGELSVDLSDEEEEGESLRLSAPTGGKVPYRWESGNPLGPQTKRAPPQHRKKKY